MFKLKLFANFAAEAAAALLTEGAAYLDANAAALEAKVEPAADNAIDAAAAAAKAAIDSKADPLRFFLGAALDHAVDSLDAAAKAAVGTDVPAAFAAISAAARAEATKLMAS